MSDQYKISLLQKITFASTKEGELSIEAQEKTIHERNEKKMESLLFKGNEGKPEIVKFFHKELLPVKKVFYGENVNQAISATVDKRFRTPPPPRKPFPGAFQGPGEIHTI